MFKLPHNFITFFIVILAIGALGYFVASQDEANNDSPVRNRAVSAVKEVTPEKSLYDVKASRNEAKSKLDNMLQTKEKLIKDKEQAIADFDKEINNAEANIKTLEKELADKENILQEELKK